MNTTLNNIPGAAPAAVAPQGEYPHEQMDAMALARYKVVPSHASMLWSHAVVAGDGVQQLYVGREAECQNMARKFAGAFLDGAFAFHSMAAAPTTQAAPALEAPAASHRGAVNDLAQLLFDAWAKAEPEHGVTKHPMSYWASFCDMARTVLAAAPQAPAAPAVDAFTHAELLEIKRAAEEFADCNETDVDYALLLRAAQAGYLECTQFHVLNQSALDLDTVAATQAREGGAA